MKHVDGHVPLPMRSDNENCLRCALWTPSHCQGVRFDKYYSEHKSGHRTGYTFPCYDGGVVKQCIYVVATPENIAQSVTWRLTR